MPDNNRLSGRELEILGLVATGASNKEIARKLFISTNTVKVHLRNIFSKIEVASRTEAAMYAVRQGIVLPGTVPGKVGNERAATRPTGTETSSASGVITGSALDLFLARVRENRWIGFSALGGLAAIVIITIVLSRELTVPALTNSPLPTTIPRWQELAEMPTARYGLAAAAYENQIYAIGGETLQGVTGVVERYDPETNIWVERSPKPLPVVDVDGEVIGGMIYVPGGRVSTGGVTNYLEVYNIREDKWEKGAPLPMALSAYALVAFEGKLYLFGGWDGGQYLDIVFEYEPEEDIWRQKTSMPTARGYAGAAVVENNIYVIGGYDGNEALSVNEVYMPDRDDDGIDNPWDQAEPMPGTRSGMGVASVANIVLVIDGGIGNDDKPQPIAYLPQSEGWQTIDSAPYDLGKRLHVVVLGAHLYTVGGKLDTVPSGNLMKYRAIYTVSIPVIVK